MIAEKRMQVVATRMGFYGSPTGPRRFRPEKNETFFLETPAHFSQEWMQEVELVEDVTGEKRLKRLPIEKSLFKKEVAKQTLKARADIKSADLKEEKKKVEAAATKEAEKVAKAALKEAKVQEAADKAAAKAEKEIN